jgi:acetyl esterase/lipase
MQKGAYNVIDRKTRTAAQSSMLVALLLFAAVPSRAQDKATYYTVMHPEEFKIDWKAFYTRAEEMTAETRKELPNKLNIAYGSDPKQQLDVYMPKQKTAAAPVFIFLHGGGFREGDRAQYGYVARPFGAHGIVTVVASYRLLPTFKYPDQPNDVHRVVAWVFRNIKSYGGDPRQIYVGGHSAGAILTADVSVRSGWQASMSLPPDVIKGAAPISGPYDLTAEKQTNDYASDAASRDAASPLLHVEKPVARNVVAVGSPEPFVESSRLFSEALRKKGASSEFLLLDGLDHAQTVAALGDERSKLFQAILTMITARAGAPSSR